MPNLLYTRKKKKGFLQIKIYIKKGILGATVGEENHINLMKKRKRKKKRVKESVGGAIYSLQ